jgi:hypothetical protein
MTDESSAPLLCPSARCEPDSILLGVVMSDGRVGYLRPEQRIDADFVAAAHGGRAPEKRFRFAQPCVEGRCSHWTGSRCGVIQNVLESVEGRVAACESRPLPRCTIRPRCRWFAEHGTRACAVCPLVVTEPAGAPGDVAPTRGHVPH